MPRRKAKQKDEGLPITKLLLPAKEKQWGELNDRDARQRFLRDAVRRYDQGYTAWTENFELALNDVKLTYGSRWPKGMAADRKADNRPTLDLNREPGLIDRTVGDFEQKPPGIKITGANEDAHIRKIASQNGKKTYSYGQAMAGIVRSIEAQSDAMSHYKMAYQHMCDGGFSWLRVLNQYCADDTMDQELRIKWIRNRFSVIVDPSAIDSPQLVESMNWAFISRWMSREEFNARYPDAAIADLAASKEMLGDSYASWRKEDQVMVSEYFYRIPMRDKLYKLSDGRLVYHSEINEIVDELMADGVTIVKSRDVIRYKVMWSLINGSEVLEPPQETPFSPYIPLIPVLGKEHSEADDVTYRGLCRYIHDASFMHEAMMSAATERVALTPTAQWTGDERSIKKYRDIWYRANSGGHEFLPFETIAGVNRPERLDPPAMPAAEINMAAMAADEVKDISNIYDAALGNVSNEISGKAIRERVAQTEKANNFGSNFAKALPWVGRVLVVAIPRVYDGTRAVRLLDVDGSEDWIEINTPVEDEETKKLVVVNDLGIGKYDVTYDIGPSYATMKQQAQDGMIEFVRNIPQIGAVAADIIADMQDWPLKDRFANRIRRALINEAHLTDEEKEEAGMMNDEPSPPGPEQVIAEAKATAEVAKADATKAKAEADVMLAGHKVASQVAGDGAAAQGNAMQHGEGGGSDDLKKAIVEEVEDRLLMILAKMFPERLQASGSQRQKSVE